MHHKRNGELLSAKREVTRQDVTLGWLYVPRSGPQCSIDPMIYTGQNPPSNDLDLDPKELDYQLSKHWRAAAAGDDSLRSRDSAQYIPNGRREASRPPRDLVALAAQ